MNKKVLSAILFSALFAGTGTFTSCIDNDEPAGIEELRGAKAELIRAKVTVEQANAALVLAQAEVEKAKAAKKLAEAKIEEAKAKIKEAKAEAEAARTEEEKARIEASIAKYEQQIEQDALNHKTTMVNLQNNLAQAQRAYELLLAHIEIAKATCSDADKKTIAELEFAVFTYSNNVETLTGEFATLEEAYYNLSVGYKYSEELMVEAAEKAVADAEQSLKDAQDDLAYWTSYQVGDESVDAWMEKVAELEDSIALLEDVESKKKVELDVLKESEEYALLVKAMLDARKAYNNQTVGSVYSFEYLDETKYTHTLVGGSALEGTGLADAAKAGNIVDAIAFLKNVNANNAGYIAGLQKEIDSYTTEKIYWLDSIANWDTANETAAATLAAKAKDNYDKALATWKNSYTAAQWTAEKKSATDAIAAYKKTINDLNIATVTPNNLTKIMELSVANYNKVIAAVTALKTKLVAYYTAGAKMNMTFNVVALPVYNTSGTLTGYTSKSAKDWLSADGVDNLIGIINETVGVDYFVAEGEDKIEVAESGLIAAYVTSETKAVKSVATAETLKKNLEDASEIAFGNEALYHDVVNSNVVAQNGYLHNVPSAEDVKYVYNKYEQGSLVSKTYAGTTYTYYANLGLYGFSLLNKDVDVQFEAHNYVAIIENLEAAVEYWNTTWETLVADRAAAKKAKDDAEEAESEYAKQWNDREEELDELKNRIDRLTNMSEILAAAIKAYLPADYTETVYDVEKFAEFLETMISAAETDIYNAKVDLAAAQANKELALDGKYDALAIAKENLDKKLAELTEAQAKLDEATANLKKGLEIIAAMNSAE